MSPNMDGALSATETATMAFKCPPVAFHHKELVIGCTITHYTGTPLVIGATDGYAVEKAHQHFSEVEHLELTASCESVLEKVASYTKVTHLTLTFGSSKCRCSFEPHVTQVLSVLRLVHLSLTNFSEKKLSIIADQCPQLEFLGICACGVEDDKNTTGNFSNLENLRIGSDMKEHSFFKLLRSCPGLRELHLENDELTTAFIAGSSPSFVESTELEHLQRLTLRTNRDGKCGVDTRNNLPSDLDSVLLRLPSLRRVRTDNFKIRLHIASCFPNILLEWCVCSFCSAEFPKIDDFQNEVYTHNQFLDPKKAVGSVQAELRVNSAEAINAEDTVHTNKEVKRDAEAEVIIQAEETLSVHRPSKVEEKGGSEEALDTAETTAVETVKTEEPANAEEPENGVH
ncbi:hypothetical protein HPB49_005829 [Dermacentor silvarum]|uniref:Uncharacterized protein n=1 Tax=Dermacentor silvarum TaxID=543639 RepID=A0ACB8CDF6_DERSI|nr:hypothetical protein HPB49_005829 [Dermacentor silvarum]